MQDRDEYAGQLRARVNQLLSLITALVMLAVIIALLGVLITMLLSVMERTHEIGLLQARLRAEHLATHVAQTALLDAQQVRRYSFLRGYTSAQPDLPGAGPGAPAHPQRQHH